MPRKSKYTPETVAKIVEAIKLGATYELAAGYAGIGERTFYDWLEKYPQFSQDIKAAEGTGAMIWLAKIERAASDGNWQAAAWKLERRYPHMYGKTVQAQEHSGVVTVKHGISSPNDEAEAAAARDFLATLAGITRRSVPHADGAGDAGE